jgi:predicted dehydrogenase
MRVVNVALIGEGFMGRTHSNAWQQVGKFFKPPTPAVMHTSCGRRGSESEAFSQKWGWQHFCGDWKEAMRAEAIDLVDIVTPNTMHAPMALEAIAAGKHVACEKPIATSLDEARQMAEAARGRGSRPSSGTTTAAFPPWRWPIAWSVRAHSAPSATFAPSTSRTGPTSRSR